MGGSRRTTDTMLSERQRMIIQILTQTAPRPVTLSTISEKLGVSSRTIHREMSKVERWLEENDFQFIRKPGIGLAIQEDSEKLELIQELLEVENIVPMFSRQERRRHMLGNLLFADEPIKSYVFISSYNISEGTLSDDLVSMEGWLKDYGFSIIRRPGSGIFLEGSEASYRQAVAGAVFGFEDTDKILGLLSGSEEGQEHSDMLSKNPLLCFLRAPIVRFVEQILQESQKKLQVKYMDSGYIGLLVRISLMIYRIQNGKYIENTNQDWQRLLQMPEWEMAGEIARKAEEAFSLQITREEIAYITMYLSSARIWSNNAEKDPLKHINLRQIVMSMAGVAEQMTGLPFRSCTSMIDDLVDHVNAVVNRASMNLGVENPPSELVMRSYPEIYSAVEVACELLREFVQPAQVSDGEIGFIAAHFAAAAEQLQENEQKIEVAVVCPAGIGSSKVLAVNLKKSFHNIDIRKIISAFDIDTRQLLDEGIDLIISTIKLNTDFPYLQVGMVLQMQDKLRLQDVMETINRQRLRRRTGGGRISDTKIDLDYIRRMSLIGNEIVEILQNFRVVRTEKGKNKNHLIELASEVFGRNLAERRKITADIRRREELGDTYLDGMDICLFHCRTNAVEHSRFGYMGLEHPFDTEKGPIIGAVIMLVPEDGADKLYEPLGRLSALLVENNEFLLALQSGDASAGIALAEEALVKYYQQETTKRIGVN